MSSPLARNLRKTRPMLWSFSLALGLIYVASGLSLITDSVADITLKQPQQVILIGVLGAVPLGIFSLLLGITHFVGILGSSYRATMAAYYGGMFYLTVWSVSYLYLIPSRPGATAAGLAGTLTFILLTLAAIKERVEIHNVPY